MLAFISCNVSSHTSVHTYTSFHVPSISIHTGCTSANALFIEAKPSWNSWLACNVLTACCRIRRGLGWHLTFPRCAQVIRACSLGVSCCYQLSNEKVVIMPWRRVKQREKKKIKLVLSHLNFRFCKFCTHIEKKKAIHCKASKSNFSLLFSLHLNSSDAPLCWTSGSSYWGTEY